MEDNSKQNRNNIFKKKNHYFETFISKVLKQVSDNAGITSNAKQQLNSFLCTLAKHISRIAKELTIHGKKKTISDKEISNSIKIVLSGGLLDNSILEGEKSVNIFNSSGDKGSRQNKAGIIFPPSITEKFLRNFGYSKIMITNSSSVYLSAVLEYLTYEILDLSLNYCKENKRSRITIRDIEVTIRNDEEFSKIFRKINYVFLGGGVIPFIHPSLLVKRKNKLTVKTNKKYKFRPGTIAIKDIRKFQKLSDILLFPKSSFEKFVRQLFKENNTANNMADKIKISKEVFIILQYYVEQFIIKILYNSNFLAIHSGRIKIISTDIAFVSYLLNETKNPYNSEINNQDSDVLSINYQEHLDSYIDDIEITNDEPDTIED
jgi:histone H2A